ncbi:MAG: dihydropteroate synthase [Planctomycetota bacterium]|nr:dihydropteroate synthase [Planctomycetota bacterium]
MSTIAFSTAGLRARVLASVNSPLPLLTVLVEPLSQQECRHVTALLARFHQFRIVGWASDERSEKWGVILSGAPGDLSDVEFFLTRRVFSNTKVRSIAACREIQAAAKGYLRERFLLRLPRGRELAIGPGTSVMGVLNVTPDSFSDGGRYMDPDRAIEHGLAMAAEGADILDIGAESTRPGTKPVPPDEQWRRLEPVISGIRAAAKDIPISVDTSSAAVAERALEAGADIVNDVTAMRGDERMAALVSSAKVPIVLMHMQGTPETMQIAPSYAEVVSEIDAFFRERLAAAAKAGIDPEQTILDPGFGFGKTVAHNLEILRRLHELKSLGRPLLVGVSRKSFLGKITGIEPPSARTIESLIAGALAAFCGASIIRAHDVAGHVRALKVARSVATGMPVSEIPAESSRSPIAAVPAAPPDLSAPFFFEDGDDEGEEDGEPEPSDDEEGDEEDGRA